MSKTVLVTGASKGIGRAVALGLADRGYDVAINDIASEKAGLDSLAAEIQKKGQRALPVVADISNHEQVDAMFQKIFSEWEVLDVLVNNAGITADNLFLMMPEADWDAVIGTTLKGFYNMTKPVLKKMLRRKKGSVVSIASVAGLIGNKGQANYSAAKAGLIGASRSVASEIAKKGIRVNVVAPGLIETDMIKDAPVEFIKNVIPMGRIGKPEEVAKVVRFLCSDDASYITGQVISVNGGMM